MKAGGLGVGRQALGKGAGAVGEQCLPWPSDCRKSVSHEALSVILLLTICGTVPSVPDEPVQESNNHRCFGKELLISLDSDTPLGGRINQSSMFRQGVDYAFALVTFYTSTEASRLLWSTSPEDFISQCCFSSVRLFFFSLYPSSPSRNGYGERLVDATSRMIHHDNEQTQTTDDSKP